MNQHKTNSAFQKTLLLVLTLGSTSAFASSSPASLPATSMDNNSNPALFLSVGGGSIGTSNLGQDQYVEIKNPFVDEFFQYQPHSSSQTVGLFDAFLGEEWTLSPRWSLQAGLDYGKTGTFDVKGTLTQGADVQSEDTYNYSYDFNSNQLFAESKLLFRIGRIRPYITGGIGAAINQAEDYQTTVPPFLTFTRQYDDHTTTAFAYNVGAGVDIDLDSHLRLGVGYRFASLGKVTLGNANIDGIDVSGTLSQDKLYTNEVLAQLTFVL